MSDLRLLKPPIVIVVPSNLAVKGRAPPRSNKPTIYAPHEKVLAVLLRVGDRLRLGPARLREPLPDLLQYLLVVFVKNIALGALANLGKIAVLVPIGIEG